ncbi:MAG: heavy-metal-associated domain-containing protein [Coriobacteriia bacterium]|nr:heavy-metal-associated domain-containing protein [Coriobacteriia bacterium]
MATTKVLIDGMSCQHCVRHVTEALMDLDGVQSVEVSLEDKHAIIEHDDALSLDEFEAAIADAGYDVIQPQ